MNTLHCNKLNYIPNIINLKLSIYGKNIFWCLIIK